MRRMLWRELSLVNSADVLQDAVAGAGGGPKSELVLSCRVFWEMFVFGHNNRKDEIYIKVRAVCIASSKLCKG